MRFGSERGLRFEVVPLDPQWERRSRTDRGPWAQLGVFAAGECLTKVEDGDTDRVRNHVNVPLCSIAEWVVSNARAIVFEESAHAFRTDDDLHGSLAKWRSRDPGGFAPDVWDDERFNWYSRHFLLSGAEGALLPDVAFAKLDDRLCVTWRPPETAGARDLWFLSGAGRAALPFDESWAAVGEFVAWVAHEVRSKSGDTDGWERQTQPLLDASRATVGQFLELVVPGALGHTRDLALDLSGNAVSSVSLQVLRDLDTRGQRLDEIVDALGRLERNIHSHSTSGLFEARAAVRSFATSLTPEEQGTDAASWQRREARLDGQKISTSQLEAILGSLAHVETTNAARTTPNRSIVGAQQGGNAAVVLLENERMTRPWVRRMELARALGHLLLDAATSAGALGAASSAVATGPRRRRSGAFAAELLMPEHGVRERLAGKPLDGTTFEDLMAHFEVGARTAAYRLWNAGIIDSAETRDELIEEHGAR